MALVRQIHEYGAVCWDPRREGKVSALNRLQNRAAKFANNINEFGWETVAQCRLTARICAIFKTHTGRLAWKAIGNRLLKSCYLSWGDHNRKIRTRKQRTDVGKYSFVNRIIKSWNQLPASLLASFPCKLNTFRKRVKNIYIYIKQDATLHRLFYLETALHVSGGTSTHHQERKQLYLQHLVFVIPLLLPATIVEELETV